jgi:predicted RNA-binding Zn-ribbon protein involved in translation (DUF1610 family)
MLMIKCAACKTKLWKYDKIGQGEVLRCHKKRITRRQEIRQEGNRINCLCGKDIGIDKGSPKNKFTFSGVEAPAWQGARRANSRLFNRRATQPCGMDRRMKA